MAGACMGDIYRLKQHPQVWRPRRCPLQRWRQPAREATAGIVLTGATARGAAMPVRPLGQSVDVTVGPTMPWREITMHGDVMRIR
ncbi:hypothetical protein BHE74_00048249 [Ensete ventricosum]|nr:hypothetical protein BHE74_00048249 [Ensete ventricosum]